ncbi:MAG: ABC-type amino acid transport substrate-binding protein, partial [Granulosicoccus sp.]
LVEDVNLALLYLRENGAYDELYAKWFGVRH